MTSGFVLSRPFNPADIPADGTERRIVATPQERERIAEGFGLLGLTELSADLELRRWRGEGVEVAGKLTAQLSQACVVTLEPVGQSIDETFLVHLAPEGSPLAGDSAGPHAEIAIDPDAEDPPDVFSGVSIDLGGIVEEQLALLIDPYPRAPGAELPAALPEAETKASVADSPFAALAKLAARKPKDGQS